MPDFNFLDAGGEWRERSRTVDGDGKLKSVHQVRRGRDPEETPVVGTPAATSTLYDDEGRVKAQWVKTRPDHRDPETVCRILADELAKPLPRVPIVFESNIGPATDMLMACYPVGDHHLGMLSWRPETGTSYDIEIGERLLNDAFCHLLPLTPKCGRSLIAFLGDFLHYDSETPETPKNKNRLDADSRYQKMVRAALRVMRRQIEAAATWHRSVEVIVEPGNHDPYSALFLSEALANIYEDNPRIKIDTTPRNVHYLRFGRVLLGTHHGDTIPMAQLPNVMAADRPQDWGETEHRYWWTGHIHTRTAQDFKGVAVESFRILPPTDAWAAKNGYRPIRDMKAIVLHTDHGEVARYTVNPKMLEVRHQ